MGYGKAASFMDRLRGRNAGAEVPVADEVKAEGAVAEREVEIDHIPASEAPAPGSMAEEDIEMCENSTSAQNEPVDEVEAETIEALLEEIFGSSVTNLSGPEGQPNLEAEDLSTLSPKTPSCEKGDPWDDLDIPFGEPFLDQLFCKSGPLEDGTSTEASYLDALDAESDGSPPAAREAVVQPSGYQANAILKGLMDLHAEDVLAAHPDDDLDLEGDDLDLEVPTEEICEGIDSDLQEISIIGTGSDAHRRPDDVTLSHERSLELKLEDQKKEIGRLNAELLETLCSFYRSQDSLASVTRERDAVKDESARKIRSLEFRLEAEQQRASRFSSMSNLFWPDPSRRYSSIGEIHFAPNEIGELRSQIEARLADLVAFSCLPVEMSFEKGGEDDPAVIAHGILQGALVALKPETATEGSLPHGLALRAREISIRDKSLAEYARRIDQVLTQSGDIIQSEVRDIEIGVPSAVFAALLHYRSLAIKLAAHSPELKEPISVKQVRNALIAQGKTGIKADIVGMTRSEILNLNGVGPSSYAKLVEEMFKIGYDISPLHSWSKPKQDEAGSHHQLTDVRTKVLSVLGLGHGEAGKPILSTVLENLREEMGYGSGDRFIMSRIIRRFRDEDKSSTSRIRAPRLP